MQSMFYSKSLHNYPYAQDDYTRLRILAQRHTIGKMAAIFLNCLTLDPLTSIAFAPLSSQSAKPLLCCQYICLYQWKECSVLRKRMSGHSTLSTDITVELLDYFICLFFSFALFEQILMLRLFSVGACSRCFNRKQNSGLRILILKSILSSSFFLSDLRKSERISNVWIYICYIIEPWCSTGVPRYTSVPWEFIN